MTYIKDVLYQRAVTPLNEKLPLDRSFHDLWQFQTFSHFFFPQGIKGTSKRCLQCPSCWSNHLDHLPFSTASLIRLFIQNCACPEDQLDTATMMMIHFLWLFPLLCLLPPGSPVMLVERAGVLRPPSQMLQPEGRALRRSKRDWMWRQFFLSEEYMGNNYQYVGKVRETMMGLRESTCLVLQTSLRGKDVKKWEGKKSFSLWGFMWHGRIFEYECATWRNLKPLSKKSHENVNYTVTEAWIFRQQRKGGGEVGRFCGGGGVCWGGRGMLDIWLWTWFHGSHFQVQSDSPETWWELTITGYFIVSLQHFFTHWLPTHLQ